MSAVIPVAIVGMAVLVPGAPDLDTYWHNLSTGADCITEVPAHRWDATHYPRRIYCRRGGFVDQYATVDPARFGVMPSAVPGTEPDQLIALRVAARALADAGGEHRLPPRERIGVVLGRGGYLTPAQARNDQRVRTAHQLVRTLGELLPELDAEALNRIEDAFADRLGPDHPDAAIGLVPNLAASRIANRLDLRGPAYTTDAACASSLVAVDQAVAELASGRCDVMLAGGVHHCHDITLWSVFARLGALSQSERSRPFHAAADGLLIGEGTGIVVLKRLIDAERDGDRVYAVIRGTGVAADGRGASLVSPDPGGQARAVRQAWQAAGLDPRAPHSIGLLEAHGTGTPTGDAAELATLAEAFGPPEAEPTETDAVIGSVKSMIGHTMPAAGIAGLVKAALAVHHATLLPTLHCDDPHPALARTRFRPLAAAQPWEALVRRAAVNAFGFGGINAHVVLEQAPQGVPVPTRTRIREPERVLRLTADSATHLAELLEADDATLLAGAGRAPAPGGRVRLAVVAPDARRLALARRAVAKGQAWRGRGDVWFTPDPLLTGTEPGKVAFVFPGLEAEFAPRVAEVADHFGLAVPADARVGDLGRHGIGVLAVGRVLDAALRALGIAPDGVAGHSIGEWSAMLAGGLYDIATADALLADFDPARLCVPGVAFAVIGAPAEQVQDLLGDRTDVVLSHDNAPAQSMICGAPDAVDALVRDFRARQVIARTLPFRSGFHTPMLAPYLGPLTEGVYRAPVRAPRVPVWSGTTAAPFPTSPDEVRELFARHLVEPVRFRPLIQAMYAAGYRAFVQVGTGQLGSLIAATLEGRDFLTVPADSPRHGGLDQLRRVVAALWTEGSEQAEAALGSGLLPTPPHGTAVRLDLGAASVSLPDAVRADLRARLLAAVGGQVPGRLDALAERFPAVAALRASLAETADTAAALFPGAQRAMAPGRGSATTAHTRPPAPAATVLPFARPPSTKELLADAPPPPPAPAPGTAPQPPGSLPETPTHRSELLVSAAEMPYLLDHCLVPQRPGWPDLSDRHPVVPATTVLRHMMDAAERALPGRRTVAVHDVRLERWLAAEPATRLEVEVRPDPDGHRVHVALEPYARATLELADAYPPRPPARWRAAAAERPCTIGALDLYRDRWMFHGPAFQGVTELTAIGDSHIRGVFTTPQAPGALLDCVGQLLGHWILAERTRRTVVFPVRMCAYRFFGPEPAPDTRLDCHIKITSLTATTLTADVQIAVGDTVWAEITGWQDRRFDVPGADRAGGYPEHRSLSEARPGGWALLFDAWPELASRDLIMRTQLGAAERAAYAAHPPRTRRQWLLGRIAAKDAVRHRLWQNGSGAVFPAEIGIRNDTEGRPYATGVHGRRLPPLQLSLAHRADAAVALVREQREQSLGVGVGVGIDIEVIAERAETIRRIALDAQERALLAEVCEATAVSEAVWFTRFWAAKEAAAKAEGTGLRGSPRQFAVRQAQTYGLLVETPHGRHRVRLDQVAAPAPGSQGKQYVVAWTANDGAKEHNL
nr:type I polyketide synthase [Streptomyces sp. SLBN-118]